MKVKDEKTCRMCYKNSCKNCSNRVKLTRKEITTEIVKQLLEVAFVVGMCYALCYLMFAM